MNLVSATNFSEIARFELRNYNFPNHSDSNTYNIHDEVIYKEQDSQNLQDCK